MRCFRLLTILSLALPAMAFEGTPPVPKPENPESHWAFALPIAGEAGIDELVDRGIAKSGLKKSPAASREILVRRAWHVVTGLTPTAGDLDQWLADPRPDWLGYLLDDLLARPTFGERWARHWLDIARYADTRGAANPENEELPYAYTYRDWVIGALNRDLPYDQFIRDQIAADLMDLPREDLAALGFLTVGRSYQGGQQNLVIADQIDVSTRSVMGLTVACARCHDHKSDPIPTADFYSLYGVFASSSMPDKLPVIAEPDDSKEAREFFKRRDDDAQAVHDHVKSVVPEYAPPEDLYDFNLSGETNGKLNQIERERFRNLVGEVSKIEASSPYAPARAMVLRENDNPYDPVIFERGDPGSRGETVPRAFLTIFREKDEYFTGKSGRLEFAQRLTDDRNPLTARVWANRVWMHLMGTSLVDSPGDFGVQTEEPLQHELLDHLAIFLQKNGWSTKTLIRHIMTSEAWQRSSAGETEKDPANRYFARANRVRLDLEAWRDSALQISGRLDSKMGGIPFQLDEPPFPGRRTIYGKVRRGFLPSILRAFDFPGSEEALMERTATTTPTQALYLMNSPFLLGEARAIAAADPGIREIYQAVLQRDPEPAELAAATTWMEHARHSRTSGKWDYGYLRDGSLEFQILPRYENEQWLGMAAPPDPELGWLQWNRNGGHPENDKAVTLKWTAIESGRVSVDGSLKAQSDQGNGVRARILRTTGEILGEWVAEPTVEISTKLPSIEVTAGETLYLSVDSRGDCAFDGFSWAPVISDERGPLADAREDFGGPGLEPLAQLAQVLLLSNEFFYVD